MGQASRHQFFIFDIGIDGSLPCRLHDMAGHNSQRSGINALLIYHTVSIHPSLTVEIVDRCHQMLVSLILSITGEMLNACCHSQLLDRIYIGQTHTGNSLRIRTKGTGICNGITEIRININNWSKGPVGSHSSGFSTARFCHLRCHCLIIGSRDLHGRSYQSSFFHNTIAALFQVGCNQGIYFTAADNFSGGLHSILCRHDPVHESAGVH